MKYTVYKNRFSSKSNGIIHNDGSWADIVDNVVDKSKWDKFNATTVSIYASEKEQFNAIVMAEMRPNMPRTADNVIAFHAIILDIDDGASYDDVRNDLRDYEYVLYSSGGTGLKQGDRFRVILPLNVPMPAHDWKKYNTSLSERFSYSDECFKKGIQIQYLPVLNTAFADQFIGEHHEGRCFDYQMPNDLPFVENRSLESIVKNVVFDELQFSDIEMQVLARAIVDHQSGQLGYEARRILAQRLKCIGMNDFDIVQVINQVSKPGFSRSNDDVVKGANAAYARPEGLYKNVAKGVRIPAIERRIVRSVASHTVSLKQPQTQSKYDGEWTLEQNEYISDISHEMDFNSGINLLIADVGTGKTVHWTKQKNVKFVAPLTSIVDSMSDTNSLTKGNVGTWNQIEGIINTKDKSIFRNTTLVVDECHGLFVDYGYKSRTINRLINAFSEFKSVILMSGTVEADHFSSIEFNKVYRVHKPSHAQKFIRTVFCTKKDDVVINHINSLTNKTIVLMNNKDLCEVTAGRINRKSLVVNADVKKTPEVQTFFKNKTMGSLEVIIGTNSIVEGLSIEDELTDVDIVIWGDLVPERIEQFCNRFRNVSSVKNVWYFVDRKPVEAFDDYNRTKVIGEARTLCEALQAAYEAISSDTLRRSFIRQFSGDMATDLVFFHDGQFQVSCTGIDYEYSLHREKQYRNDFSMFAGRLRAFDFNVYYPLIENGDEANNDKIKEEKALVTEMRKNERKAVLERLRDDIEANTLLEEEDATELYNATYGSVQRLLEKGLDKSSVPALIDGYIEDDAFIAKAYEDVEFEATGSTVREFIIEAIGGKTELRSDDIMNISNGVISKVLAEYFNGDVKMMSESRSWGGLVVRSHAYLSNDLKNIDLQACDLVVKSPKAAKEILMKYIKLGKGKTRSIKGSNVRISPVDALSRTGLVVRSHAYLSNDLKNIDLQASLLPKPCAATQSESAIPALPHSAANDEAMKASRSSVLKFLRM
ncbi:hypothetical protein [Serratia liquefaciens]|uniref:hypothetical protein n=1 Tax=Serratia liquefaciens TaxID=614 RepID=UPI00217A803A|nr:hypothetical protein [Serratia liquefaciens]CAI1684035.1 Uncharacterised protein [Serratia liquefaciens]